MGDLFNFVQKFSIARYFVTNLIATFLVSMMSLGGSKLFLVDVIALHCSIKWVNRSSTGRPIELFREAALRRKRWVLNVIEQVRVERGECLTDRTLLFKLCFARLHLWLQLLDCYFNVVLLLTPTTFLDDHVSIFLFTMLLLLLP